MPKLTKEQLAQIQEFVQTLPEEEREDKLKEVMSQLEEAPLQCPFCLMSEGKIKTTKIFEDNYFLAVLEINPANKGHTILFTKRHIKGISELNEQEAENLGKIMKNLTISLNSFSEGISIINSEGQIAGQRFEHFVINFIPRSKGDSVKIMWQPKPANEEDLEKTKQEIIENFPKEKPKAEPIDEDKLKKEFYKTKKRLP